MSLPATIKNSLTRLFSFSNLSSMFSPSHLPSIQEDNMENIDDAEKAKKKSLRYSYKDYLQQLQADEDAAAAQKKIQSISKKEALNRKKIQKQLKEPMFINDLGDEMSSIIQKSSNQNQNSEQSIIILPTKKQAQRSMKKQITTNTKKQLNKKIKPDTKVIKLDDISLEDMKLSQKQKIRKSFRSQKQKNSKKPLTEIIRKMRQNLEIKSIYCSSIQNPYSISDDQ